MEKFMYPSKYMRITLGCGEGKSHKGSYAIDDGGSDTGTDYAIAPYSGTVKRICELENEVWFVSDNPVLFADGTEDYATTLFLHQNSPMKYGMAVGKHYNQGEKMYDEGARYKNKNDNPDIARHFHFEFAKGTDANWHKNSQGVWILNNSLPPYDCCFINDSYHILNDWGYNFVNLDNRLVYEAYCQDIEWQGEKHNNEIAGTTGQSKRLEAFRIRDNGDIYAKIHIQEDGWKDLGKVSWDTIIGTMHQSKGIECICLKGNFEYRVHIAKFGWSNWTRADGICTLGSVGQKLSIEAIQIKELG